MVGATFTVFVSEVDCYLVQNVSFVQKMTIFHMKCPNENYQCWKNEIFPNFSHYFWPKSGIRFSVKLYIAGRVEKTIVFNGFIVFTIVHMHYSSEYYPPRLPYFMSLTGYWWATVHAGLPFKRIIKLGTCHVWDMSHDWWPKKWPLCVNKMVRTGFSDSLN